MKKRIVRITATLCAAALLAGCGSSIGSKDGGYYATEAAAQESYANYDSAAGGVDSGMTGSGGGTLGLMAMFFFQAGFD